MHIQLGLIEPVVALIACKLLERSTASVVVVVALDIANAAEHKGERLIPGVRVVGINIGGTPGGIASAAGPGAGAAKTKCLAAQPDLRRVVIGYIRIVGQNVLEGPTELPCVAPLAPGEV